MKSRPAALLFIFVLLPLLGCQSTVSQPSVVQPVNVQTDPNGPIIQFGVDRQAPDGAYFDPIVTGQISTSTGTPIIDAAVTLVAPGGANIPVTYTGNPPFYAGEGTGWAYTPGQTYTFKVVIGGKLYTSSVVAPGGVTVPNPNSGNPITWAYEGNMDEVQISGGNPFAITVNSVLTTFDAHSPFSTAGAYPTAGDYSVDVTCWTVRYSSFANANPGCMISATDQYSLWIIK
jgi:hypothetical protein